MSLKDRPKELAEEALVELARKRLVVTSFSRSNYLEQKFTQAMNEAIEACAKEIQFTTSLSGGVIADRIRKLKIVEKMK